MFAVLLTLLFLAGAVYAQSAELLAITLAGAASSVITEAVKRNAVRVNGPAAFYLASIVSVLCAVAALYLDGGLQFGPKTVQTILAVIGLSTVVYRIVSHVGDVSTRSMVPVLLCCCLLTTQLACDQTEFQKAQKVLNRAAIALDSAPILIDSLEKAGLIDDETAKAITDGIDSFAPTVAEANRILQGLTVLDSGSKITLSDKLALAISAIDRFQMPSFASEKAEKRVRRILELARELLSGAKLYLEGCKVTLLPLSMMEDDVKELEHLVQPVNSNFVAGCLSPRFSG